MTISEIAVIRTGLVTVREKKKIEASISCIEYVVVHEFTHFLQPNHSKKFYQQLAMFMPDWEARKTILEKGNTFVE